MCSFSHSAVAVDFKAQHDDSVWFPPLKKKVWRENSKIDCTHMYNSQNEKEIPSIVTQKQVLLMNSK